MPANAASTAPDPCALLADEEIRSVQDQTVVERTPSRRRTSSFHVLQCFYRTESFAHSVSVALSMPTADDGEAARRYWNDRFHPEAGFPADKRRPPHPIQGLGEEAYWVGDPVSGSLYVLAGKQFLRVSVGGVPVEAVRRDRARALAERALSRLASTSPLQPGDRLTQQGPRIVRLSTDGAH